MLRLATSRLGQAVPVLFLMSVLSFLLLHAAPGDPARLQAGLNSSPQAVAAIRRRLELDRPLAVQFGRWLTQALRGDLGTSYTSGEPVTHLLAQRAPVTIQLTLVALIIIVGVGIPVGVLAALHRGGLADHTVGAVSLAGIAIPNFIIGLLLVLLFGWYFPGIMPYQGYVSIPADPAGGISHTLLPALALAAGPIAIVARLTRAGMLEVLGQEYIVAARALGVPWRQIVLRDALRNALLPVLTVVGLVVGFLLSGAVVVESVFNIPGLGLLLVNSFAQRDYPVTIGVMLVVAVAFLLINLITDLLYGVLNPKIRASYRAGGG
ncbi:MAG TPA: ABC transporter permease [Streptosporangiaceae bacterium]|nr:ABC transporter permease [Streptosporangiaceae bacterium]